MELWMGDRQQRVMTTLPPMLHPKYCGCYSCHHFYSAGIGCYDDGVEGGPTDISGTSAIVTTGVPPPPQTAIAMLAEATIAASIAPLG